MMRHCTQCGKDGCIFIGFWKSSEKGMPLIGPDERLCTQCAKSRGVNPDIPATAQESFQRKNIEITYTCGTP